MMNVVRTGIDIIEVGRFSAQKPELRRRFIDRVFTEAEQAYCADRDERLAGRFACKEAVSKALGTGIGEVGWRDIEILDDPAGAPVLYLHGEAQLAAERAGLTLWSVSISHIKETAAAVAVGIGEKPAAYEG